MTVRDIVKLADFLKSLGEGVMDMPLVGVSVETSEIELETIGVTFVGKDGEPVDDMEDAVMGVLDLGDVELSQY